MQHLGKVWEVAVYNCVSLKGIGNILFIKSTLIINCTCIFVLNMKKEAYNAIVVTSSLKTYFYVSIFCRKSNGWTYTPTRKSTVTNRQHPQMYAGWNNTNYATWATSERSQFARRRRVKRKTSGINKYWKHSGKKVKR